MYLHVYVLYVVRRDVVSRPVRVSGLLRSRDGGGGRAGGANASGVAIHDSAKKVALRPYTPGASFICSAHLDVGPFYQCPVGVCAIAPHVL